MNPPRSSSQPWRGRFGFDPRLRLNSLQTRLTLGIVTVAATGLGSVAVWMNWQMKQVLIAAHQDNLNYLAQRLPKEVEHYSGSGLAIAGVQPAIDNLMYEEVLVWVSAPEGEIIAQSMAMSGRTDDMTDLLMNLGQRYVPMLDVYETNGRYFVFCQIPLIVKGMDLGWLHIAKDITADQQMLLGLTHSLSIASVLTLGALTVAIAFWIRRALQPLRQMSHLANTISVDDLGQACLQLDSAPEELRDLAQTLEQMLLRLAQAWEQQKQFVSNVSHELRTPLTIVDGYLQSILRRSQNLTELQREGLEVAASETDRTIRLLQDLLDLARADSGHIHLHLERLCLDDLTEEVAGMGESCSSRLIRVEYSPNPIWVLADRDRLKQILLNLVDNAVKYSDPPHPIILRLSVYPHIGQVQVIDRGQGIALLHQTRIFERFYRVDEARSRDSGGTGLGLSIVKTLVEVMGGKIEVQSQPGEGSTFTVTLPLSEAG